MRDLKLSPKPNSSILALKINPITRWIYGSGGVSYGVVDNAHYFTLLYYSQVLGLDARLAGLALGIGLVSTRSPIRCSVTWFSALLYCAAA